MKQNQNLQEKRVLFPLCLELAKKKPTQEIIVQTVCDFFKKPLEELQSKSRKIGIVTPRQICMYLTDKLTDLEQKENAGYFGGRDRTTAIHSIQKVRDLMDTDADYVNDLIQIVQRISAYFYMVASSSQQEETHN